MNKPSTKRSNQSLSHRSLVEGIVKQLDRLLKKGTEKRHKLARSEPLLILFQCFRCSLSRLTPFLCRFSQSTLYLFRLTLNTISYRRAREVRLSGAQS